MLKMATITVVARSVLIVRWSVGGYLDICIVLAEYEVLLCSRRIVVFLWLFVLYQLTIVDLQYFRKGLISDTPVSSISAVAISADVILCALLQFILFEFPDYFT